MTATDTKAKGSPERAAIFDLGNREQVRVELVEFQGRPMVNTQLQVFDEEAEALPGRTRPGARLILRGNLVGALRLVHGNVKRDNSPGACLALLTSPDDLVAELELWRYEVASGKESQR